MGRKANTITKIVRTGNIDNTNLIREYMELHPEIYGYNFLDQKLMFIRYNISILFNFILKFKESDDTLVLREPYKENNNSNSKIKIDQFILESATDLKKIDKAVTRCAEINSSASLVIEALDINNIYTYSWDDYLDKILTLYNYYDVSTISFPSIIDDMIRIRTDKQLSDKVKSYLMDQNISFDESNYYYLPYTKIIEKYWKSISFSIRLYDTDFYDATRKEILDTVIGPFFEYVNDIVITIKRYDWDDNFAVMKNYLIEQDGVFNDTLITYRINTVVMPPKYIINNSIDLERELTKFKDANGENPERFITLYSIVMDTNEFKSVYTKVYGSDESVADITIENDYKAVLEYYNIFDSYKSFFDMVMSNKRSWAFEFTTGNIGNEGEPYTYNEFLFDQETNELLMTPFEDIGSVWVREDYKLEDEYKKIYATIKTKIMDLME